MNENTKQLTKRGLVAAVVVLLATVLAAPSPASAATSDRFGGANRYGTAAAVSEEVDDCIVAVANGEAFPDGLTGAVFGWPILLTEADSLPAETVAELDRLDTKCGGLSGVLVLGGTAAVSSAVVDQLQDYYIGPVRIGGATRYETAIETARLYDSAYGIQDKTVVLTTGQDFPDALAVGAGAAKHGTPILLNDGASLRPEVVEFLQEKSIERVVILGGPGAVPETIDDQLQSELGLITDRLAGADRYETAIIIALVAFPGTTCALLVNGESFPDALAAGPLGTKHDCPILLANRDSLPAVTAGWLTGHAPALTDIYAIGGPAAVSDGTLDAATAIAT